MKRFLTVIAAGAGLLLLAGVATAQWGGGPGWGHGPGAGYGPMGPGMMGGGGRGWMGEGAGGPGGCPGFTETTTQITEDKAKELAQSYADQYLKGFTVERVLPFTGMHHTMYSVELKNQAGEIRSLHINPFGNVIPFGGPWQRRS